MAKEITRIYLRRPKDEIEHAPSSLRVYDMHGRKEEDCCTKFAGSWGCTKCELCCFLILSAVLLVTFIALLCWRIFLEPPLPAWPWGMVVPLPLGFLIDSIILAICLNLKNMDYNEQDALTSCICKTLLAVALWLLGGSLGVLSLYLADRLPVSLVNWILLGYLPYLLCLAVSLIPFLLCFCLSAYMGK